MKVKTILKKLKQEFQSKRKLLVYLIYRLDSLFSPCSECILIVCADDLNSFVLRDIFRHIKSLHKKGYIILLELSIGEINSQISCHEFLEASIQSIDPKVLRELWLSA